MEVPVPCCKHLNSELGAQTALHLSVSKGVIQRKKEAWLNVTSSSNDASDSALWHWQSGKN